jgi:hypothetical protein
MRVETGIFLKGSKYMKYIMGIDQYGKTYHNLGKYPRKELLERLGYKKAADKMYRDKKDGSTVHCGYVIGGLWIDLYTVESFARG